LKGLLKGFWWPFRSLKSVKYFWSYGPNEVCDTDYATGGVLSMKYEDGKWRPVAFISKSLNAMERNYKIHDKEMLAVIRCLEAWRHYLEGAKLEFEIWTDHKNL